MQIAKKGLFWIVLSIILIPSVFALEWPTVNDFMSIYQNYYGWIDFFLAFMIFASIARLFVEKKFGTESAATKPLYVSLGLVLAIALVTWEVQSGFYLFQLGFVSLILLLIVIGVIIYNLIKDKTGGKDSKLDWAQLLFGLAVILFAILLFFPELLAYIPIADPDKLMGYAAAVCGLVALWFLARWLLGKGKDKEPKGGKPTKDGKPTKGENGGPEEEEGEKEKEEEKIIKISRATIIVQDEKKNVGTEFVQGAKLSISVIIENGWFSSVYKKAKSNVRIEDLKLEWILKDSSTKLNCVFGGKGSGYFAGDREVIEFETAKANIGLIQDKSKKTIDITLNIIDPNTNKVLMEKKEDIKILPSATAITEEEIPGPAPTGNPAITLKDNEGYSPKRIENATEIVDSSSYKLKVELNEDAKNLKDLKVNWSIIEINTNGKAKGDYIPIALMDYEKGLLGRNPSLIYSDLLKTIRIKGYKTETNFLLFARLLNPAGAVKNKDGNEVFDYIAIKVSSKGGLPQPPGPQPSPEQQPAPAGKTREPEIMVLESTTGRPSRTSPVPLQAKSRLIINPNQTMLNYMKTTPAQFFWYAVLSDSAGNEKGTQIPIGKNINLEMDYNTIAKQEKILKGNIYKIYCLAADSVGNWITKSDGKNYVFDFILVRIDYPSPFGPNKPGAKPEEAQEPTTQTPEKKLIVRVGEETRGENRDAKNPTIVKKDSMFVVGVNKKDPDFRFWWMLLDKEQNWIPVTISQIRTVRTAELLFKLKKVKDEKKMLGDYLLFCYLAKGENVMKDIFDFTTIRINEKSFEKQAYPGEKLPEYTEPPVPISRNNAIDDAMNKYVMGWLNEYINTPQYKKSRLNIKRDYTPFAKWLLSNRKATLNGKAFDLPMWIRAKYQLDIGEIKLDENYLKSRIEQILNTAAEQTEKGQKVILEKAA